MKNTRHSRTNFKGLQPFLHDMARPGAAGVTHKRYQASGFMPLVFEYLHFGDYKGRPVYSMTHYSYQNGDVMRDPDMTFSVDWEAGTIEPQTFTNDFLGIWQQVYRQNDKGQTMYSQRLRVDLDEFLWQWLKNIAEQGYELEG